MSFSIDGTTASTLNVKLKSDYQEPGSPDVRKRETTVPGRAGVYDFGAEYDVRTFELPLVTLDTTTQAEVQNVARNLANELTDDKGKPKEVELKFDKEPAKYYEVKLDSEMGITRYPGNLADIQLNLVATTPFALKPVEKINHEITTNGGSFQIQNDGTVETPVRFEITNTGGTTISGFKIYQEV